MGRGGGGGEGKMRVGMVGVTVDSNKNEYGVPLFQQEGGDLQEQRMS